MPKTLDEILSSPYVGLPRRSYPICLAGKLLARFEKLDEQFRRAMETEGGSTRKRVGTKDEAKRIATEMEKLRDEMDEHTVHVTVEARPDEWRAFCAANPAREDNRTDTKVFASICNSDALIAAAGDYVVAINDAEPKDGQWEKVWGNAVPGDRSGLAKVIAEVHESSVDVPKSRLDWLREWRSETDSE